MPAPQTLTRSSCDALRQHLRSIGRIPLLSHAEEITLGKAVQALRRLDEIAEELTLRAGGVPPAWRPWPLKRASRHSSCGADAASASGRRIGWWRRTCALW